MLLLFYNIKVNDSFSLIWLVNIILFKLAFYNLLMSWVSYLIVDLFIPFPLAKTTESSKMLPKEEFIVLIKPFTVRSAEL